jgi:hypothetical protein
MAYTSEQIASMKRQELQSATCQVLGKDASKWILSATNAELREALTTGEPPSRFQIQNGSADLAAAIATAIQPLMAARLDEERVLELIDERVKEVQRPRTLEVGGETAGRHGQERRRAAPLVSDAGAVGVPAEEHLPGRTRWHGKDDRGGKAGRCNGFCLFPHGELVRKHADCVFIAAGNTIHGATAEFNAAQKQDLSVVSRFVRIEWPIDEDLERSLASDQVEWVAFVQELRRLVASLGIRSLSVTPRATLEGADALRAGMPREDVEQGLIWTALPEQDAAKLKANLQQAA